MSWGLAHLVGSLDFVSTQVIPCPNLCDLTAGGFALLCQGGPGSHAWCQGTASPDVSQPPPWCTSTSQGSARSRIYLQTTAIHPLSPWRHFCCFFLSFCFLNSQTHISPSLSVAIQRNLPVKDWIVSPPHFYIGALIPQGNCIRR